MFRPSSPCDIHAAFSQRTAILAKVILARFRGSFHCDIQTAFTRDLARRLPRAGRPCGSEGDARAGCGRSRRLHAGRCEPTPGKPRPGKQKSRIQLAQAQAQQTPAPDAAAQTDQQGAPEEPIGNVATLTGVATVTRNNTDTPLQLKDDIYLNDVVKTQATSSLSITFNDATTFRLSANAEITIDNYVYEEGGAGNAGTFDIARGTVAFVAAQVAKTGKMEISTPTATLGIRGTTGVVDVPEGVTATSANNVNIKLYPDADGRVGQIEINDRQGARLGALTQGASGFAIRAGAGGARFAAVPIVISPQQQQRDQGFVRQVHSAQNVGRQIVTQQRAFRRANPGRINPNAPRRQGGQQQPGQNRPGQPGQNRRGQQQQQPPGAPNNRQENRQENRRKPARPAAAAGTAGAVAARGPDHAAGQSRAAGRNASRGPERVACKPGATGHAAASRPKRTTGKPGATRCAATPRPKRAAGKPGTARRAAAPRPERAADKSGAARRRAAARTTTGTTTGDDEPGQQNAPPATPAQPNVQPRPSAAPPLPNGQPILRQGQPQFAPGAPRPGLLNRPGLNRPALPRPARQGPPPKDKKKQ